MIYKNDSTKIKLFINKYKTKMFLIYGFAILFNFILFYLVLPKYRPDFEKIKYVFLILFPALACYCIFLVLLFSKKLKKNYVEYAFEVSENKFIVTDDKRINEYEFKDINKIEQIEENKFIIYFNNHTRIVTSEFLENKESFYNDISKIHEIKKSSKNKIINILSWIFCIGFFTSRFIPNIWVYIFFAIGFIITSIINSYQIIFSNSKLWSKIYIILFDLIFDTLIIFGLYKLFSRLIA
ncbi:MAG TPA: hypothetical protein DCZ76_01350 [Treponema sp.]|nr:hypothetical protein [Treponema sp.]